MCEESKGQANWSRVTAIYNIRYWVTRRISQSNFILNTCIIYLLYMMAIMAAHSLSHCGRKRSSCAKSKQASFLAASEAVKRKKLELKLSSSVATAASHTSAGMSVWLVSVPNEGTRSSETTFLELKAETASTRHDYAGTVPIVISSVCLLAAPCHSRIALPSPDVPSECFRVELPSDLLVGTLDSLMVQLQLVVDRPPDNSSVCACELTFTLTRAHRR